MRKDEAQERFLKQTNRSLMLFLASFSKPFLRPPFTMNNAVAILSRNSAVGVQKVTCTSLNYKRYKLLQRRHYHQHRWFLLHGRKTQQHMSVEAVVYGDTVHQHGIVDTQTMISAHVQSAITWIISCSSRVV